MPLASFLLVGWGWEWVFYITGGLGLVWVLWWIAVYRAPPPEVEIEELRSQADVQFRATEQRLQAELRDTEQKLGELQAARKDQSSLMMSPEQQAEVAAGDVAVAVQVGRVQPGDLAGDGGEVAAGEWCRVPALCHTRRGTAAEVYTGAADRAGAGAGAAGGGAAAAGWRWGARKKGVQDQGVGDAAGAFDA